MAVLTDAQKAELKAAAGLSSAGVAQNLRRIERAEIREEALPRAATGYQIADDRAASSPSGAEGDSAS